jgi:hypothetical protein
MNMGLQRGKRFCHIASDAVEQLHTLGITRNGIEVKPMWML